jgi:hypothetical protein
MCKLSPRTGSRLSAGEKPSWEDRQTYLLNPRSSAILLPRRTNDQQLQTALTDSQKKELGSDCSITMKPANPKILTINGGSSSIKFALFDAGDSLRRILSGGIERIGLPEACLRVKGPNQADNFSSPVAAPDHKAAVGSLMDWIEERGGREWIDRSRSSRGPWRAEI